MDREKQAVNRPSDGVITWIALLGRRETPTDGVEDYCHFLADALTRKDVRLETVRVDWHELGWIHALRNLRRQSARWRGSWVIVHYTALSWSRRGFPFGVLLVLSVLRRCGLHCTILFHEAGRQLAGSRLRDKARGAFQEWVIRSCFRQAEKAIFTIPLEIVTWLPRNQRKAVYIPIGANIPVTNLQQGANVRKPGVAKTVAVFCLSLGEHRRTEIAEMAHAAERARDSIGTVRFVVLGKGSAEARDDIETSFNAKSLDVRVLGSLPADKVADTLAAADVQLYLGGYITQTRGSALAGVACGLPIVGYAGVVREPIHDAGVELVRSRNCDALASALVRVLKDDAFRFELRRKSSTAYQSHFSWDSIAEKYLKQFVLDRTLKQSSVDSPPGANAGLRLTDKMRILIFGEYFFPSIGGVQTAMDVLARGFAEYCDADNPTGSERIEVTVATNTPRGSMDDVKLPYRVVRNPTAWMLRKLIRDSNIVHLAGPCFLPMLMAWMTSKPVIVVHHVYQAICPNGMLFKHTSQEVCTGHFANGEYAECVRCCSRTMGLSKAIRSLFLAFPRRWLSARASANVMVTRHVSKRLQMPRSRTIYLGIDRVGPLGPGTSHDRPSVIEFGYVGRLIGEKGLPLLLEAAKRLANEGRNFRLTFIGDGPERQRLESLVNELGLRERVLFVGELKGNSFENAARRLTALVMPSICEETAGLAAIEQMMRGHLIIAADHGGLGEVVGDAGLLFPVGDISALADCMRLIMDDPPRVQSLACAARARAETYFSSQLMIREHLSLCLELLRSDGIGGATLARR